MNNSKWSGTTISRRRGELQNETQLLSARDSWKEHEFERHKKKNPVAARSPVSNHRQ